MPLLQTSGNVTADGYGGGVAAVPNYIEDVFSTYLFNATGSTVTVNNGIDLSTKGGLLWLKQRNGVDNHILRDNVAMATSEYLKTNSTAALSGGITNTFLTTGFSTTAGSNGNTYASWSFRKQPKFFDVVTYTGNAAARTIAHSLGSVPGSIWIKRTDSTSNWAVYHRQLGTDQGYTGKDFHIFLNLTNAQDGISDYWDRTAPTSTVFSLGANAAVNTNGATYVAYVFAHNAGGFGLTGTDNVISCGSYTGNGSTTGPVVTLGYEPQWLLVKNASASANWALIDNMRAFPVAGSTQATLLADSSAAELNNTTYQIQPNATGFQPVSTNGLVNANTNLYIYIAIRRGPMKVPTSGTSVFEPVTITGNSTSRVVTNSAGFPIDAALIGVRSGADNKILGPRLTGQPHLLTNDTAIETTNDFPSNPYAYMNGISVNGTGGTNQSGNTYVYEMFRRAPSFFDVVCYTGTGVARTINHNLGVAPELMIVKSRSNAFNWSVYNASIGATNYLYLNLTTASSAFSGFWNDTSPTASVFSVGGIDAVNGSGFTYVAYLFATCAGVSKVGSYTGTGATQTIACGFTGGARFVLVKRTDSTGDWYVWDTARGMVSGTDPSLLLNSTAAEVNANSIYTTTGGFQIVSTAAGINASGGSYIFLAVS